MRDALQFLLTSHGEPKEAALGQQQRRDGDPKWGWQWGWQEGAVHTTVLSVLLRVPDCPENVTNVASRKAKR